MARKSVLQGRQFKYIKGGMYTLNFFVGVSIVLYVYLKNTNNILYGTIILRLYSSQYVSIQDYNNVCLYSARTR